MATAPNPATSSDNKAVAAERRRIPMSTPVQKLDVPSIPGYHLHWFNGTADRIQRAIDGGYEHVTAEEMKLNPVGLGSNSTHSGNTDMGSGVSVVAGGQVGPDGQAVRLVLMKIKEEWWREDQSKIDDRGEHVVQSLGLGAIGAEKDKAGDSAQRYVDKSRTKIPDMFVRKAHKPT